MVTLKIEGDDFLEDQVKIRDIIDLLLKRLWIILICGILAGGIALFYSMFFMPPQYTSTGKLYVFNTPNRTSAATTADINTSVRLVKTYSEVLRSETFTQIISQKLNSVVSASLIKSMTTLSGVGDTEILQISVTSTDKDLARDIVQAILLSAPDEIMRVVKAGAVEIIDNASTPKSPTSPNIQRNTIFGAFFGMVVSIALIFIVNFFDNSIKDEGELTSKYNLPVLGIIPSAEF